MPKVFRAMKEENGKPATGQDATRLGLRRGEVPLDSAGLVQPSSGGLSVRPSLQAIPIEFVPRRLAHLCQGARGNDRSCGWSHGQGPFADGEVAPTLRLRIDQPNRHGLFEPKAVTTLADFEQAIAATRNDWIVDEN